MICQAQIERRTKSWLPHGQGVLENEAQSLGGSGQGQVKRKVIPTCWKCPEEGERHKEDMSHHEPRVSRLVRIALSLPVNGVVRRRGRGVVKKDLGFVELEDGLRMWVMVTMVPVSSNKLVVEEPELAGGG
jgi:hypothetical protein